MDNDSKTRTQKFMLQLHKLKTTKTFIRKPRIKTRNSNKKNHIEEYNI